VEVASQVEAAHEAAVQEEDRIYRVVVILPPPCFCYISKKKRLLYRYNGRDLVRILSVVITIWLVEYL
jgi:hypothetical protein